MSKVKAITPVFMMALSLPLFFIYTQGSLLSVTFFFKYETTFLRFGDFTSLLPALILEGRTLIFQNSPLLRGALSHTETLAMLPLDWHTVHYLMTLTTSWRTLLLISLGQDWEHHWSLAWLAHNPLWSTLGSTMPWPPVSAWVTLRSQHEWSCNSWDIKI